MNFNTMVEKHHFGKSEKVEKPQLSNAEQKLPKAKYDFRLDSQTIAKEQLIAEMFPELGDGFIYKCLEHFDFNNERVVDAILESNLPTELNSLDRKLTKFDLDKVASMLSNKKLDDQVDDQILADSQKYDPVNKTNYQLADIYVGKKDKLSEMKANKEKTKDLTIKLADKIEQEEEELKEQIKMMIERGKLQREDLKTNEEYMGMNIYDDEFDDTYENEDENFDIEPVIEENVVNDDDDNDDAIVSEDLDKTNNTKMHTNNQSNVPKYRMTNEKYENCTKYLRKQLYNNKYQQRNNQGKGQQSFNSSYGSNEAQQSHQRQRQSTKNQQHTKNVNQDHNRHTFKMNDDRRNDGNNSSNNNNRNYNSNRQTNYSNNKTTNQNRKK